MIRSLLLLSLLSLLVVPVLPAGATAAGYLGVLFARENVEVSAETAGVVRAVHVGLGDEVAAGQPLIALVSEDLPAELEQGQAALATAQARGDQAAAELAEVERLLERRRGATEIFTAEEVETLETRRQLAEAELEAARSTIVEREAALHELERRLESLTVRAPFAGAVAACHLDEGARVRAGEPLVRLISTGGLWVRFAVPSSESGWLAVGARVVAVPGGSEAGAGTGWSAEVRRVAPEIDPATDMVFAEASLVVAGEGGALRAGEVVRVRRAAGVTAGAATGAGE